MSTRSHRTALEVSAWTLGLLLLGLYLGGRSAGELERRQAIVDFTTVLTAQAAAYQPAAHTHIEHIDSAPIEGDVLVHNVTAPSRGGWSSARIRAYEDHVHDPAAATELPVALLRIPRVELEVPVYAELNERNLNRGAAWVQGTAPPDGLGNVGIAAHRDGYFRTLQNVLVGDTIELALPEQQRQYRITQLSIVDPTDITPLQPTDEAALTLVTCYPFYFVGSAPQRYIVRAEVMP